jgi:hypothetical protein
MPTNAISYQRFRGIKGILNHTTNVNDKPLVDQVTRYLFFKNIFRKLINSF